MIEELLQDRLKQRAAKGQLRALRAASGVDLTSHDYFGFARTISQKSAQQGATGSRLLTGHSALYEELEERLAAFHSAESCLIYNSAYIANLGLLAALGMLSAAFLYDLEIHASMIDGMRLCNAKCVPFRHNDLASLEGRLQKAEPPCFVLVESHYSMSGDLAPLQEMAELCKRYKAGLIVDEAHATGLFGPKGEGRVLELTLQATVFARVHSFSHALGAHGGAVFGSHILKEYLINFSRPLIYTTALPPAALQTIANSYDRLALEAKSHQEKLRSLIGAFCGKEGASPIQPFYTSQAREISRQLLLQGIDVRPVLPPTVAKGKECLRIVLHSFNTQSEIDRLLEVLACAAS